MAQTATLAPGARVLVRDEEWLVLSAAPAMNQATAIKAVGLSELVRGHERVFLSDLDKIEELRPEDTEPVPDTSPGFRRSRLYLGTLLRRTPPMKADLNLGHLAAIDVKEYQLRPAHQALSALRPRILMADGVGLGKTIQVGILLSELIKRGRGERILVVAIKSMLGQFQQEMWARFAIGLTRLDSVGLQRVRAMIPANKNPFYHFNRAIISIDTLKNDGKFRHYLEQCNWDAIVIDECHNVANADTQRNRLAGLLASTCDSLILTSATPHNGRPESFANLINMLDPTAIADPSEYTADEINGLYTRNFKKDVEEEVRGAFGTRHNHRLEVQASPAEAAVLDALGDLKFSTLRGRRRSGRDALFATTLFKSFLSAPVACLSTIDRRLKTIDRALEKLEPGNKQKRAALSDDRGKLRLFRAAVAAVDTDAFSKYQRLVKELKALKWKGTKKSPRVIIFSERVATLEWLRDQLTAQFKLKDKAVRLFHAGLPDVEQQAAVEEFGKEDAPVRLLLASDVASEGVNLHYFCQDLVHFDIPWSLITLEQRNGRIDRYGQKGSPTIRYLLTVCDGSPKQSDLRIVRRLAERADMVETNLGDAAKAMGLYSVEAEEDLTASAMEDGVAPDAFLPDDEQELDFLDLLEQEEQNEAPGPVPRTAWYGLYPDDASFVRAAFEEILDPGQQGGAPPDMEPPEWHPQKPQFTFLAPEELRRRCHLLPREAIPRRWELLLSADRQAVMDSIEEARKVEGQWPRLHLLWELHPLYQWLLDRLQVRYGRHEAPVVVAPDLGPATTALVFEGMLSNRRSQPVVHDWFAVVFQGEASAPAQSWSLKELLERSGFTRGISNPGAPSRRQDALAGLIPAAVEEAREHMERLRMERGKELGVRLRQDTRRLRQWHQRATALLEQQKDRSRGGRERLPRNLAEKYQSRQRALDRSRDQHERWLTETFQAEKTPYLHLGLIMSGE